MNQQQSQLYELGRQAHAQGYGLDSCNVRHDVDACFWKGGGHQADMESGVRVYQGPERRRASC